MLRAPGVGLVRRYDGVDDDVSDPVVADAD